MDLSVEPVQYVNCLPCIHAKLTLTAPLPIQHLTSPICTCQPSHCCFIVSCLCTWEVLLHPLCWHNSWEFSSAGQSKKINAKIEGWTNTDKARKWPCSKSLTKQRWLMSATGGYAASHSSEVLSCPSDPGRIFFFFHLQAQMSLLVSGACWQQHSSSLSGCIEETSKLTFVWGWTEKAPLVCFNYPHAGTPHRAPHVKVGSHLSPAKQGSATPCRALQNIKSH